MSEPITRRGEGLLGAGMTYAMATVAPVVVALLVTPVVTRALGAEGYGVVGIAITLYQFGSIVFGFGLSAAITRHAIIANSGVSGAVALVFVGGLLSLAVGGTAALLTPLWAGPVLNGSAPISAMLWPILSAVSLSVLTLCQSVFRAISRVRTFVLLGVLAAFSAPLFGLGLVALTGPTPTAYVIGLASGHTLSAIAGLLLLPRITRRSFSVRETLDNLRIGLPTVPHSVASALLVTVVVILASQLGGVTAAGRLQLGLFLGTAPLMVLAAFNNAWAPMIYRTDTHARASVLSRSMRAISVLVFILVAGFCVLLDPVARFVAGPAIYNASLVEAALVAAIATPLMALYLANISLVFLSGKTILLAVTTPASLVFALAVLIVVRMTGVDALWVFAAGIPLFHASQFAWSIFLRRRVTDLRPSLRRSLVSLVPALLLPVLAAVTPQATWTVVVVAGLGSAALVAIERKAIAAMR